MPGVLAALAAKLAGLGTVAKAAIAAVTAALTMTVAGGATGVLPLPGEHGGATAVAPESVQQTVSALGAAASNAATAAAASAPSAQVSGSTAVGSSGASPVTAKASASTGASTTIATSTTVAKVTTQVVTPKVAAAAVHDLTKLPACLAALVPASGSQPDLARIRSELPACILSLVKAHLPLDVVRPAVGPSHLPVDLFTCLASALKAAPAATGTNLSGLRQLLAGCLPTGVLPGTGTATGAASLSGAVAGLRAGR